MFSDMMLKLLTVIQGSNFNPITRKDGRAMQLVARNIYNGLNMYQEKAQRVFTRNEIGVALGYKQPDNAIAHIHNRHKNELNKCSGVVSLSTPGGNQEVFIYTYSGVMLICHYSTRPEAANMIVAVTEQLQRVVESQQVTISQQNVTIANLNSDFASVHQLNKEIKAENRRLAAKAKLELTPEGRAAKTMHDAIKAAICTERYGIYKERSRMSTSREIIGVYDKNYLYVPMDRLLALYNGYSAEKLSFPVLRASLIKSGLIATNTACKVYNKTINGDRVDCEKIPLKYVEDIVSIEL